ncbi:MULTISPECIES: ferritin [Mycolicibacter]|uniref:Ferritin n=1 Tax=[Mycobacterium] vasticus TaxID=2875777 RepID=A0ABU5Z432_9MYCO|nr:MULTISPECIES: ferritin [unclassified Mycolicibacter]MEB3064658.1 ferritin [Mycolicibacter sp. MYC101]MEB3071625.1 ferritin [Mycolicibacter sp. MYC017]
MSENDNHTSKFHALLQEQIYHEFTAAQQYVAVAVYFDGSDLPQLAKFFYSQAVEERSHAMMMVQYLLDRGIAVDIPGTGGVRNRFDAPRDALALMLDQENTVTEQVSRLTSAARDEGDHLGEQFMGWFLTEQVEEVSVMTRLLRVADRAGHNMFELENFIAREVAGPALDRSAPRMAGG